MQTQYTQWNWQNAFLGEAKMRNEKHMRKNRGNRPGTNWTNMILEKKTCENTDKKCRNILLKVSSVFPCFPISLKFQLDGREWVILCWLNISFSLSILSINDLPEEIYVMAHVTPTLFQSPLYWLPQMILITHSPAAAAVVPRSQTEPPIKSFAKRMSQASFELMAVHRLVEIMEIPLFHLLARVKVAQLSASARGASSGSRVHGENLKLAGSAKVHRSYNMGPLSIQGASEREEVWCDFKHLSNTLMGSNLNGSWEESDTRDCCGTGCSCPSSLSSRLFWCSGSIVFRSPVSYSIEGLFWGFGANVIEMEVLIL